MLFLQILTLIFLNLANLVFSGELVSETSICEVHKNYRLPNPNDCTKFYDCKDGETYHGECRQGLLYDPTAKKCILDMDVTKCINHEKNSLSAEPFGSSCKQYILWFNGKGVIRQCGEGLTFNEVTTRCDFEENVECPEMLCRDNERVLNVKSPQSCSR